MWLKKLFNRKPEFIDFVHDSSWMLNDDLTPNIKNLKKCKAFYDLKNVRQSKKWHREGNAWKHTLLVAKEMYKIVTGEDFPLGDNDKRILMIAALCHDLGKVHTTYFDEKEKDWKCRNHGAAGERITRNLIFDEPNEWFREEICWLVRWHMTFHHLLQKDFTTQVEEIHRLSWGNSSIQKLLYLNIADSLGSIAHEHSEEDTWNKFKDISFLATQHNCYNKPFVSGKKESNFNMYVMIGLPGSGKDTYIEKFLKKYPVICRDDVREEILDGRVIGRKLYFDKLKEAQVTDIVNTRIKNCCGRKMSFVVNQTNMKRSYRNSLKEEAFKYGTPNVVYVYVEAPSIDECKKRRGHGKWDSIIDRMWKEFEFPDRSECDQFVFYKQRGKGSYITEY